MANFEKNICEAIEIIANKVVANAGYDKTIQATILSCVNESAGKYKLRYQESNIYAFTGDENKKYSRGTQVYVLVPGSDMSKNKTILGEVGSIIAYDPNEDITGQVVYERNSENLIQVYKSSAIQGEEHEMGIYSQYQYNKDTRYGTNYCPYSKINDLGRTRVYFIDKEVVKNYVDESKYFFIGAYIKTNFKKDIITTGNYGIKVHMKCTNLNATSDDDEEVINTITLDISNGITSPYYIKDYTFKYYVFPIPENFKELDSVELFCEKFEYDAGEGISDDLFISDDDKDIFFKSVGLYTANAVSEILGGNGITLSYPKGRSIYKSVTPIKSLEVSASVIENSKLMSNNQHSFYWFKEDLSVLAGSSEANGYCSKGGPGWCCLNERNDAGWIPASNNFIFNTDEDLLDCKNNFKVVATRTVGTTEIVYQREFVLYNYNYDYIVDIYSSKVNNFQLNNTFKDLDLICRIKNNNFDQTEIPNHPNQQTDISYDDFTFHWAVTVNGICHYDINMRDIFTGLLFGDQFTTNPNNSHQRYLRNINLGLVRNINSAITFSCTVKQLKRISGRQTKEITLTTVSTVITLDEIAKEPYQLNIINKIQSFQYDVHNKSPFQDGIGSPLQLGIKLIDNQKNEEVNIESELRKGTLEIKWIPPENYNTTLLLPPNNNFSYVGSNSIIVNNREFYLNFDFRIKDTFDYNKVESSVIKVVVKYKGLTLQDQTQFLFVKVGQYGTNGTEYTAKIVGKWCTLPRWVTFTSKEYYSIVNDKKVYIENSTIGYFNFNDRNDENLYAVGKNNFYELPFNIQLYKNGEIVPITENNVEEIKWYMKTDKYGNPLRECRSNFFIGEYQDPEEGISYPGIKYYPNMYTTTTSGPEDPDVKNDLYNKDNMREYMPSNILCCRVTYKLDATETTGKSKLTNIYAYLPIVRIVNRTLSGESLVSMPLIDFDIDSGYKEVIYSKDGTNDPYFLINNNVFKVKLDTRLFQINNGTFESVGVNDRTYEKNTYNYTWKKSNNITIKEDLGQVRTNTEIIRSVEVDPAYTYKGDSSSNGILFRYEEESENVHIDSFIHIPICLHLNQYSLGAFNDWDGTTIDINEDGGYIIAPQVMAGTKDQNNNFTGIVMGSAKESDQRDLHPGLYAYGNGDKTFGIYADSGYTFIGKYGNGQIIIDPDSSGRGSYIYTSEFFTDDAFNKTTLTNENNNYNNEVKKIKADALKYPNRYDRTANGRRRNSAYYGKGGMLIDLSAGGIYFGNGNFALDKYGNMTTIGGHIDNGCYDGGPNNNTDWAYIDLNPGFNTTDINTDIPSEGIYNNIVKFGNKFRISKKDGITLSSSGLYSNLEGSMFLNLQPADDGKGYIVLNNKITEHSPYDIQLKYKPDEVIYPTYVTDFMLYCSDQETFNPNLSYLTDARKIKFGVTKNGNIIATKGKVGNFYITEDCFSTRYDLFRELGQGIVTMKSSDIALSSIPFSIDDFPAVSYRMNEPTSEQDHQPHLVNFYSSFLIDDSITINNVRFALGNHFAITANGNVYCSDVWGEDLVSQTIHTGKVHSENIYSNYIRIENSAYINGLEAPTIKTNEIVGSNVTVPNSISTDGGILTLPLIIKTHEIQAIEDIGWTPTDALVLPPKVVLKDASDFSLPWTKYGTDVPTTLPEGCFYFVVESTT